jgi:hypothetical protein
MSKDKHPSLLRRKIALANADRAPWWPTWENPRWPRAVFFRASPSPSKRARYYDVVDVTRAVTQLQKKGLVRLGKFGGRKYRTFYEEV